jgi:hypothetical protein
VNDVEKGWIVSGEIIFFNIFAPVTELRRITFVRAKGIGISWI